VPRSGACGGGQAFLPRASSPRAHDQAERRNAADAATASTASAVSTGDAAAPAACMPHRSLDGAGDDAHPDRDPPLAPVHRGVRREPAAPRLAHEPDEGRR
jgi:hypothetical protein